MQYSIVYTRSVTLSKLFGLSVDSLRLLTPVSNQRMAKWPPHSTETFESIRRGEAVMAAPHMVCENCSHLFISNCM